MEDSKKGKRRQDDHRDRRGVKRSKGGSGGKWQTPHQKSKIAASYGSGNLEPGDVGIWATCGKDKEFKAAEELKTMFEECAERFYGITSEPNGDEGTSADDIESSIMKEVASLGKKEGPDNLFSSVRIDLQCVLFFKTSPAIDPVDFVHRICVEIVSKPGIRRMRYVNRLTPVTMTEKATEKGIAELGKTVLGRHFHLAGDERSGEGDIEPDYSYAIRPTIRNHSTLKREAVIKQIASMVRETHKVDLTKPDKVIIVEIYQTVCGMSVVESDWEEFKRFNLAELYRPTVKAGATLKADAKPQSVTKDEAPVIPLSTDTDSPDP